MGRKKEEKEDCLSRAKGPARELIFSLPPSSGYYVMVLNSPSGVAGSVTNCRFAQGRVPHTQDAEFGWHPAEIRADAIEIGVGCTMGQRRGNRVLGSRVLWYRLFERVHQNGIDVGEFAERLQES